MKTMRKFLTVTMGCAVLPLLAAHVIKLDGPVAIDEEGLILGNGDLSCSVFQEGDETVFRFGKGDVWDRRIEWKLSEGEPPTHDEFVRGLLDEGWTCNSYDKDGSVAKKGTKNERRFREICRGDSPVIGRSPHPCPKPTGELRMRVAPDLPRPMKLTQRLIVEEGRLVIDGTWANGVTLTAEAVIAPRENVFSVKWRLEGYDVRNSPQKQRPPVTFALRRRADEDPAAIMTRLTAEHGSDYMERRYRESGLTPLPAPEAFVGKDGRVGVEQRFPAEKTFPDGFRCRLTLSTAEGPKACYNKRVIDANGQVFEAYACYRPTKSLTTGEVQVMVTTSRDAAIEAPSARPHDEVVRAARQAAASSFALSGVRIPEDPELENLWYATYHVRRCVLRSGTVPPGLFLPSTVNDYSSWHGDYHSNYNYQSIYWGAMTANRLDEQLTAMDCTDFFLKVGRVRARKYYGMRGAFVPLEGFPLEADRDYSTALTMGRMVYMTGWAAVPYWEYYLHTLDRDFLQRRGYPAIRDCALFYLDFLKKAPSKDLPPDLKDGLYHAFPSIEEEIPIRSLADVTDRPQVLAFVRYALQAAIAASAELKVDEELRAQWRDRLENLVGMRRDLKGYARHCYLVNSPEFGYNTPVPRPAPPFSGKARTLSSGWYFGHSIRSRIRDLRNNAFVPERDFGEYRSSLAYWLHPNGLVWGMSIGLYGRAGGWTETLSCLAPLQEMMLQSWEGAIRLFPYWPKEKNASFRNFRAQGAFLVSAEWKDGKIGKVTVTSEKGADCHVHGEWTVREAKVRGEGEGEGEGEEIKVHHDAFGRMCFKTTAGATYELKGL